MRINHIVMEPFEFQFIVGFESVTKANEHGCAKVVGYANADQKNKAIGLLSGDVWATVSGTGEDMESYPIFCGLVTNVYVEELENTYQITVEMKTGSFLMDTKEHLRVYQLGSVSYQTIQDSLVHSYPEGECLMLLDDGPIGEMVVQYRETDWEFAKRLASRKSMVIFPNEKSIGVKYAFGVCEQTAKKLLSYEKYQLQKNIGEYQEKKQKGAHGIREKDAISYVVKSREIFYVGDSVEFNGENWIVRKVHRYMDRKELWNSYELRSLKGMWQEHYYNTKIIGAALSGQVSDVSADKVKVKVTGDENKNLYAGKLFDYATIYSSPDGSGWYFMPEKNDTVQLQFPDERESHAYVSSSVNEDSKDPDARSNADYKSIKNIYQKEILFTPTQLILTNNKGMEITIDDAEGITIKSDKNINLDAKENIVINSEQQGLQLMAAKQLMLTQNNTTLELADTISMNGEQVNMQ